MNLQDTNLEITTSESLTDVLTVEVDSSLVDTAQSTFEQIKILCAELLTGTKDTLNQTSRLLAEAEALKKEVDIYDPKKR